MDLTKIEGCIYQKRLILYDQMKENELKRRGITGYHKKNDELAILYWTDKEAKMVWETLWNGIHIRCANSISNNTCTFCIKHLYCEKNGSCRECEYAINRNGITCYEDYSYFQTHIATQKNTDKISIPNKWFRSTLQTIVKKYPV
jgi:hypothetical protein